MSDTNAKPDARAIVSLLVLSAIVGLNTVDRNMFGLLLPQIKQDIAISDAALGFLIGPAFMIVYSVAGLPIAWLADRSNRRNIVVAGLALWSGVTMLTGFAQTLAHLLVARIALGVAEASNMAPTSAIIGDLFRGGYRVIAMAVFAAGGPIAIMVFFPLIGAVAAKGEWRSAYFMMGAIGIGVALAALLVVREAPREVPAADLPELIPAGLFAVAFRMLRSPSFGLLCAAGTMISISLGAMTAWLPSFMQRVHGLDPRGTGLLLGMYRGGFGVVATLAAGLIVTLLMRRDQRWLAWSPMLLTLGLIPAQLLLLLADGPTGWHIGLALDSILMSAITPCLLALLVTLLDSRVRATGAALYLLIFNLVGQSIGPLAVGTLNDGVFVASGSHAIRTSMLIAPAALAVGAGLLAALSVRQSRELAH
ncbi:MFS transporter [Sphingomonas hengshuiensis]|uniref:Major facilitator superfamily (MFS) profile domain-containing protein n=1 Tax=Sphingomonas hengshuiensis TaxID=1609977 RepID=A0A7U4LFH7_9SPHN|nr:MFS transporter [Sphingomonas hengshuiensis]AJP72549.1 hypothetical protein TS85_13345 [Sphingomonas hengshuiensis]